MGMVFVYDRTFVVVIITIMCEKRLSLDSRETAGVLLLFIALVNPSDL